MCGIERRIGQEPDFRRGERDVSNFQQPPRIEASSGAESRKVIFFG
jgi:hypothetical protein